MTDNRDEAPPSGIGNVERLPLVKVEVLVGDRNWSLTAVQNEDALVDLADDLDHLPYGFLLWESAVGVARYLVQNPGLAAGKRILELGCGVGLPGLVASSLGGSVMQTDHQPGVLTLARQNAAANNIEGIEQRLADWRDWRITEQFDLLIGADILYTRDVHFHLEQIFKRCIKPGGSLLISDPGRPQAVEFMVEMERSGWHIDMQTIPVRLDHEGPEAKLVEVAIMLAKVTS